MKINKLLLGRILIATSVIFATVILVATKTSNIFAVQNTCLDSGGWTKIDSGDLSIYPVSGATQYCFKAGSDNSIGCEGGIFFSWPQPEGTCGLSHWSYFIGATPTSTSTATPTSTSTPTTPPLILVHQPPL